MFDYITKGGTVVDGTDGEAFLADVAVTDGLILIGQCALDHEESTAADIAEMARLVEDRISAGAAGFSTRCILEHASSEGVRTPSYAVYEE